MGEGPVKSEAEAEEAKGGNETLVVMQKDFQQGRAVVFAVSDVKEV